MMGMRKKTENGLIGVVLSFFGLFMVIACKLLPQGSPTPLPIISSTPSVTIEYISPEVPTLTSFPATLAPTTQLVDIVPSEDAGEHVGEVIIVRIEKAFCSYRPDVTGAPTFCNDQPYPNHTFTLITWGKDWTDLDGRCVYIEGEIEEYEGKFEIIADSRNQITPCN
jgi:hypothetical protein